MVEGSELASAHLLPIIGFLLVDSQEACLVEGAVCLDFVVTRRPKRHVLQRMSLSFDAAFILKGPIFLTAILINFKLRRPRKIR